MPLTTVRQPKFRLGLAAMETMLKLLRGEPPENRRLPAELIVRASTAAPQPGRCTPIAGIQPLAGHFWRAGPQDWYSTCYLKA